MLLSLFHACLLLLLPLLMLEVFQRLACLAVHDHLRTLGAHLVLDRFVCETTHSQQCVDRVDVFG